ncbi:MAG: CehA/McbA family metallohydrolase [Elusimicrobia bacterium]|nr:CehA/McbA family metallohydrolase [Elusimicrobiota bacterium]
MSRALAAAAVLLAAPCLAGREPVLKQVGLPHSYYYREMYLPQWTSGPSAPAWSPDGKSLVYSMAGSLWRQALDSDAAERLSAGPGYDYQPDWSPDGRFIAYAKHDGDAVELWLLELASGRSVPLTKNGSVNVEPRWSPDGRRLAFVSTSHNRRFHIFTLDFADGRPGALARLSGDTRTEAARYYYSPFDHEISPTWSPDGSELLFVSNRGRRYGTGGFWRMKAEPGAEAREVHYEETSWKARPDWSPDGGRLVYSSYLGRQWHQLWVTRPEGGDAFPLSYGEYDDTAPRWSPDGTRIAFVSNRGGNTSLWVRDAVGGAQRELKAVRRGTLGATGRLRLSVLDADGRPTAARVSVTGADGRAYAPDSAWMHADDSLEPGAAEARYFHAAGPVELDLPAGRVALEAMKGFAYRPARREAAVKAGGTTELSVRLERLPQAAEGRWAAGDLHVHMNYGGAYRADPRTLAAQAAAEDLPVVFNLIVNKEQRVPDVSYFSGRPDSVSTDDFLLLHGQEFHTSYWGHLGLLGLKDHLIVPDYAAYPNTAAASLYPHNSAVADLARAQGALVGYVHPFDSSDVPEPALDRPLTNALVVDAALGKVDFLEVVSFSDHRVTAEVWYRLLNLGFRIPVGAGTDAMTNYASLRGPVGLNRVFVSVPEGPLKAETWLAGLKAGRSFASNGPLLGFTLGGKPIGGELRLPAGRHEVPFTASLRSLAPVEHVEVVCDGKVAAELKLDAGGERAEAKGVIALERSGWCLLRAWSAGPARPILDAYPYATTSPVYVSVDGKPPRSPEDAAYCLAWLARLEAAVQAHPGFNGAAEKAAVLRSLADARAVYLERAK